MIRHLPITNPKPDSKYFIDTLLGKTANGRVPLVEYLVDDVVQRPILNDMLHRPWVTFGNDRQSQQAALDNFIKLWYHLGYDFVRFEIDMGFQINQMLIADTAPGSQKQRAWVDQHRGKIMSWEDFEGYPWPRIEEVDFFTYEYLNDHLPEGMGLIVSHGGGLFEHLSSMMSYEGLCLAVHDQPDLVQAMADRIGGLMIQFYEHLLQLDRVIALFQGDDMGFRTATLISPAHLRKYVLPWHKRFVEMAHQHHIPYFLHCCGNLERILEDLIEDVRIDGKHSFENAIMPVEHFQAKYGSRIAVLGGVDIHTLAASSEEEVRKRTRYLVETCGARGRYAIGSGNSIPSYIPVKNYLAMLDEAIDCW